MSEEKATGYSVAELEAMLAAAKAERDHLEFPKFVEPHSSHIDSTNGHMTTPLFPHFHIDRDGKFLVMVHDADEETKALAPKHEEA